MTDDSFADAVVAQLAAMRRYGLMLCRSPDLADDLVQIACEKAFANRGSFDPATNMRAWLFRILRNSFIDSTRRGRPLKDAVDIDEQPDLLSVDGVRLQENRMLVAEVCDALASLPPAQQEILILTCVDELTYREAADLLEIPIGTVMSRLARARIALGEQLGIN